LHVLVLRYWLLPSREFDALSAEKSVETSPGQNNNLRKLPLTSEGFVLVDNVDNKDIPLAVASS
jgi:hypothetical protein